MIRFLVLVASVLAALVVLAGMMACGVAIVAWERIEAFSAYWMEPIRGEVNHGK